MHDPNQHNLKDLFDQIIKQNKLKPKLYEAKLRDAWPTLMGSLIDQYTNDISIKKQTLFLRITSAPLKNEFMMSKQQFIQLINKELGEDYINEIVIR